MNILDLPNRFSDDEESSELQSLHEIDSSWVEPPPVEGSESMESAVQSVDMTDEEMVSYLKALLGQHSIVVDARSEVEREQSPPPLHIGLCFFPSLLSLLTSNVLSPR